MRVASAGRLLFHRLKQVRIKQKARFEIDAERTDPAGQWHRSATDGDEWRSSVTLTPKIKDTLPFRVKWLFVVPAGVGRAPRENECVYQSYESNDFVDLFTLIYNEFVFLQQSVLLLFAIILESGTLN